MDINFIKVVPVETLSEANIQHFDCLIVLWTTVEELLTVATKVPPIKQIIADLQTVCTWFVLQVNKYRKKLFMYLLLSPNYLHALHQLQILTTSQHLDYSM